jgi:hypothetical protein
MTNIINFKVPSALSLSKQITIKFILYKLHSTRRIQKHSNCHEMIQMLMLNGQLGLQHKFYNTINIYKAMEETVQSTANTAMKEK